ncbi:MAG: hypothetical protein AAFP17_16735 [Pseudomonadota bacterium]
MTTLVFFVCLASAPESCREREIPIYEPISPMACVMQAPDTLAQWRETNPNWQIQRWSCRGARPATQKAKS